jgi:hypothetical protein
MMQEGATVENWEQVCELLFAMEGRMNVLIGDALWIGENQWGRTYQQVASTTGYKVDSLYNMKSVMERIDFSLRNEKLLFYHYVLVASLEYDDQAYWLGQAVENSWSISQMRKAMAGNPPPLSKPTKYQRQKERFFEVILRAKTMNERRQLIDDAIGELERLKASLG